MEREIIDGLPSLMFTGHFQDNAGNGPHHYICPTAIIEFGSLSNSTLCLCDRNMHGGMRGCVCSPEALKLEDCKCSAKPLLDGDMMYSMANLKNVDPAWYNSIMFGREWQILSSDMEKEEPSAAHIIFDGFEQQECHCNENSTHGNHEDTR